MAEDRAISSESEVDRSSSENVTIIAETFSDIAPSATLSSVKSEDSTEQLICKSPQAQKPRQKQPIDMKSATLECGFTEGGSSDKARRSPETVCSKSVLTSIHSDASIRDRSENRKSKLILYLGILQLLVGVAMVVSGGTVMVNGAALGRAGAGLWAGCLAIGTGILGVLAGINDCYGLYDRQTSRVGNLFLTLFLALSLVALAAGNLAAVLAGTGLLRDVRRNRQEETENGYWPPILSNVGLLLTSAVHCILSLISVYHTAKRVCSCFRPREPFNHNQFDPSYSNLQPPYSVVSVTEKPHDKNSSKYTAESPVNLSDNRKELNKILEGKLMGSGSDTDVTDGPSGHTNHAMHGQGQRRVSNDVPHGVGSYFGSANSKDKLVCSWLGGQAGVPMRIQKMPKGGVKKHKLKHQPVLLMPASAGNTMTRPVPLPLLPVAAAHLGYATLPMVQAGPMALHPSCRGPPTLVYPHHQAYPPYPINDMVRIKRKRYSEAPGSEQGRRGQQLQRSLERMHRARGPPSAVTSQQRARKHRPQPLTEADVIRTYTGLDRTIAEQFIVACDESRHSHAGSPEASPARPRNKSDSSEFGTASSGHSHAKY